MNHKYLQFKKFGLRAFEKCQIKTLNEGVRENKRHRVEKGIAILSYWEMKAQL